MPAFVAHHGKGAILGDPRIDYGSPKGAVFFYIAGELLKNTIIIAYVEGYDRAPPAQIFYLIFKMGNAFFILVIVQAQIKAVAGEALGYGTAYTA